MLVRHADASAHKAGGHSHAKHHALLSARVHFRLIWHGLELHRMRRVTWQTLASAEEAAAADGPFSNVQALAATSDNSPLPSCRVTAEPPDLTPVRTYLSNTGKALPEEIANATSRFGPGAVALEGMRVTSDRIVTIAEALAATQSDGCWALASSSHNSTSSGNSPSSRSTTEWTIKSHKRRGTHGSRTVVPSGNAAARRVAGAGGGAAAAAADSTWMDTHVGYHLLQNLGLAGGFAARLALLGSILLHGVILAVSHDRTVGLR